MADAGMILNVARRIAEVRKQGIGVVAVVSAMGDTTDGLIDLAHSVSDQPRPRELDLLLSTGELVSCTLLTMALADLGQEAVSLTGSQAGIHTDTSHGRARIHRVDTVRMLKELSLLGYFTSEIGCTQATRYLETPGRFDPCATYAPGETSWADHA